MTAPTANTAQRVAVETDERLVFVDACGDMLRKLGKPIMGRELKATAETLALEVERLLELASQITTDWIPANRKLAERAEAAESKLAEQAAEIERLKFVVLERNRRAEAAESKLVEQAAEIDAAREVLAKALDADGVKDEPLRTLAVRASNALYWRDQGKQAAERAREEANKTWRGAFVGVVEAALIHDGMGRLEARVKANEQADRIASFLAANRAPLARG